MTKNLEYSRKLADPRWQKRRLEILQRDKFTCTCCADTESELHVHHLKYTGEPYEAPEQDLKTLCNVCHYISTYVYKDKQISHAHKFLYEDGLNIIVIHLVSGTVTLFRYRDNATQINPVITFPIDCPVFDHIRTSFANIKKPK